MRPDPATMSDCHLLDEYLTVYRDGGRRHAEIRAQLESRLAACDAARAEVERLRLAIRFGGCSAVHAASLSEAGGEWAVKAVQDVNALRAELDEAMLLHGGENGKLPVSMRFPEYLDRIARLRDKWMSRREKHDGN